ncbi:MAG: flagellin [Salinarimonadaceae bacterium]|nr:MAG: flagellin [Salinarimonadaceae bacterium]
MTMSGITLTSAMRTNLLSLQGTQDLISLTQNRLATGLKVSSAIDDPRNFFQSQALNARASDLGRRLDGMGLAIKTIEAADKGITAMTKVAESMAAVAKQAQDSSSAAERTTLLAQFNELRAQLTNLAQDSGFNGTNLLGGNNLSVAYNEDGTNSSTVTAVTWSTGDPAGIAAGADWDDADLGDGATAINTAATAVNTAISTMRTQAATFGSSLTMVRIREDFTKQMVNTLKGGADGLVLADQNEEAANLLALQTRQQLGVQALSLASQSQQGILRLFN